MIAGRFEASLDLLHVVPNPYLDDPAGLYLPLPETYLKDLVKDAQKRLDEALPSSDRQQFNVRTIVKVGDPVFRDTDILSRRPVPLRTCHTRNDRRRVVACQPPVSRQSVEVRWAAKSNTRAQSWREDCIMHSVWTTLERVGR